MVDSRTAAGLSGGICDIKVNWTAKAALNAPKGSSLFCFRQVCLWHQHLRLELLHNACNMYTCYNLQVTSPVYCVYPNAHAVSQASQHWNQGSIPCQAVWNLWWTESYWDRFSVQLFQFPPVTICFQTFAKMKIKKCISVITIADRWILFQPISVQHSSSW